MARRRTQAQNLRRSAAEGTKPLGSIQPLQNPHAAGWRYAAKRIGIVFCALLLPLCIRATSILAPEDSRVLTAA
ncbi:MAG: hypothetical protein FWG37_06125, partial [Clostridia bacterium]|nr:hypothetical protein [Clostridia bacterium]